MKARASAALATLVTLCLPALAQAQPQKPGAAVAEQVFSQPIALILALGIASILPFAFMTLTAFVKISTVLQIVRGAIGAQNIPSNTLIMALGAALTLVAMAPVGSRIADRAAPLFEPGARDTASWVVGMVDATREPLRDFLSANSSKREQNRFYELARAARPEPERAAVGRKDFMVIAPAFVVSELIAAFALGFAIYLPFLIIDLVVSNVLLALGMQMMSPGQVSLPFKLLLFVAIDGWGLLAQALVTGYKAS
ncbi:MAG TPA: EscR/YscR/HrcR family type III secretion system export apparatus protein [Polyangiaceae bacterium]|nr:EscR/YscR/HrcR family type III secretion system export apparatus protein [Polyangiaceae bacterium]